MKQILWCKQCGAVVTNAQDATFVAAVQQHLLDNPMHQIEVLFVKAD